MAPAQQDPRPIIDAIVGDDVEPDPALHAGSLPWRQSGCATPISSPASGDCSQIAEEFAAS